MIRINKISFLLIYFALDLTQHLIFWIIILVTSMNHDEIRIKVGKLLNTLDCQTTYCTTSNITFYFIALSINSNKLIPCETKIPFRRIVYIICLIKTTSNVLNSLARIMFHLSASIYNCNGSQTNVSPVYYMYTYFK